MIVLHPGSYLQFDGNTAGTGTASGNSNRWDDNTPIALNGSSLLDQSQSGQVQNETVGAISFANGSRISIINPGTPTASHTLTTSSITRIGRGTLVFTPGDIFGTNAANTDNFSVTGGLPSNVNGMMPAWYVDSFHNSFVKAASVGGLNLVQVVTPTQTALNAGLTAGTDIVSLTAASTLADNPVIYALMTNNSISNGVGQFDTITLSGTGASGSNVGGLLAYTNAVTIQANIKAGANGQFELPIYDSSALTLSGDISAAGVTKFGIGALTIAKDQSDAARGVGNGYNSGWVVNEGQLTLGAFGSLGNVGTAANPNLVLLNGSQTGAAQLNLLLNPANTANATYTSGRIVVLDNGIINYDSGANDRTETINDVQVQSTGGTMEDAQLKFTFTNSRQRNILQTGVLSLTDASGYSNGGAQITVTWGSNVTNGTSSGVSVASLSGSDRLTKWGAGVLYIRGDSTVGSTAADGTLYAPFTGNVNIEEGAVQIENNNALGSGNVTVSRNGVLDLNTTNFTKTVNYQAGSIERWSADGARTGGVTVDLTGGATLQVANDQTNGTALVKMNGGSIEGFLATDSVLGTTSQGSAYRTVGAGYTFELDGASFLGQSILGGVNGLDNGVQPTTATPYSDSLTGVILEIKGNINGVGSLTKQSNDTVILSGHNSYSGGTIVNQGWLRTGADNTMPSTGTLTTTGTGVFDLNGYNQTVGALTSTGTNVTGVAAAGNGYITNTAPYTNTLTVGNGTTGDFTYAGVIQYNVALTKVGANNLTLPTSTLTPA